MTAARWSCASRTPTASARPRRTSSRSSTRWTGWSSTGTRGRSRRPSGQSATRLRCGGCWSPARPTATPRRRRTSRPGRPSTGRGAATVARRPRTPGAAVRLRVPDAGETVVEDLIRGPVAFPNASYDDFVIARGDGSVLYNFAVAVDDAEMGIDRGGARRRSPLQHAEAAAGARGSRPPPAALRPSTAAARPRRQKALQAPRRRLGAGAARRRLPARGCPQLPGPAGLGNRRRHDADVDGGAGRVASGSRTSASRRRSSTRRSCAG